MKRKISRNLVSKMFGLLVAALVSVPALQASSLSGQVVPGEYLVKLRPESQVAAFAMDEVMSSTAVFGVESLTRDGEALLVHTTSAQADQIAALPGVEYVEPNTVIHLDLVESLAAGPAMAPIVAVDQYNLRKISVPELRASGLEPTREVRIAVIDTGVESDHPALKTKLDLENAFNAVDGTKNANDDNGHGSHCAGIISAALDGTEGGMEGVARNVRIVPIKFLDAMGGGTMAGAVKAIDHAISLKVDVISASWGGSQRSQVLVDIVNQAAEAGVIFAAAAGNSASAVPSYPAGIDAKNVISVANTDENDVLHRSSNFGTSVHLAAPGTNIYSSFKGGIYRKLTGTSMSAPHVAAVAAMIRSARPTVATDVVRQILIDSGDVIPALQAKTQKGTRLNALKAVQSALSLPASE